MEGRNIWKRVRNYLRENKKTGKKAVVSVTNRNTLSVERHMELLNLNDEEYTYLDCVEDNSLGYRPSLMCDSV